jgi:hypothetical protein
MPTGDANALFDKGAKNLISGGIDLDTDTMKILLLDLSNTGTSFRAISAASNATPIVITSNSHGFSNGDLVVITGVGGNTNANGVWVVANQSTNTFELTGSAGNGAYTSGGFAVNITVPEFVADLISGGIEERSTALASVTVTNGVFDAADKTFTAAAGDACHAIILYKDTGNDATSPLLAIICTGTGLPVTLNGGDVTVQFSSGVNRIFSIRALAA